MIAIDKILISDLVVEEQFVCDLHRCKGGCCEDGEAGAPLEPGEINILDSIYEELKPYLTKEGIAEIESHGRYHYNEEFGWVTPAVKDGICAYGVRNKAGIIKCGIEQAWMDGKTNWKKPISCHLYPIKIKKSSKKGQEYLNYEPRSEMCQPACVLGEKLKVPAYKFMKEALIRKYGEAFYAALEATAKHMKAKKL